VLGQVRYAWNKLFQVTVLHYNSCAISKEARFLGSCLLREYGEMCGCCDPRLMNEWKGGEHKISLAIQVV
jgi:hypothetical protein